jgi:hypothetical protein
MDAASIRSPETRSYAETPRTVRGGGHGGAVANAGTNITTPKTGKGLIARLMGH